MRIQQNRLLKFGLNCISVYILLLCVFAPNGINLENISITSLFLLSVLAIFTVSFKNWNLLNQIPKHIKGLLYLLLFWSFIIIIRSFSVSLQDWVTNFGNMYMAFAWLMPVTLILGINIKNWNIVSKTILTMFTLMFLPFIFFPFLEYNEDWILLLRPINFVLLIGIYRYRILGRFTTYIAIVLYLFSVAYVTSRRVDQLFFVMVVGFLILDRVSSIKIKKQLLIPILIGFVLGIFLIFTVGYEYISNAIKSIVDFEDSRTFLFQELMSDLSFNEKIFGRGSLGTYYSPFFEKVTRYYEIIGNTAWEGDKPIRITTEVGYLQMILKGGFVLMLLNFIIFIYASYVAIFRAKSKFLRRLGYFIFILTILMIVEFRPTFSPIFIILWMAIGTVLNKKNREMTDEEVENIIRFK